METNHTIEIYNESHLPKNGWIQSCFNCNNITSKTLLHKKIKTHNKTYIFKVFNCPNCKKKMIKNHMKYYNFRKECNVFIKEYYNF